MKRKNLWRYIGLTLALQISLVNTFASFKNGHMVDEYSVSVTFPAGYVIGDYIEFVRVAPGVAGSAGYYEVSIAYTRGNIAAASTHLASISHANPAIWREVGRINSNGYIDLGQNFTIDCNTESANPRFRIRAIKTTGVLTESLIVYIKVRSINLNGTFTALNDTGNDLTVNKFSPMTSEWDLYVGNPIYAGGASIAIKALENGNVGIGTAIPNEKLAVNGKIRAKEIKVEIANWPDYVFEEGYKVGDLKELERFIKVNRHLPEIPTAKEIAANGLELGEMNRLLLKKVEELTLHLIEKDKQLQASDLRLTNLEKENQTIKSLLTAIQLKLSKP